MESKIGSMLPVLSAAIKITRQKEKMYEILKFMPKALKVIFLHRRGLEIFWFRKADIFHKLLLFLRKVHYL